MIHIKMRLKDLIILPKNYFAVSSMNELFFQQLQRMRPLIAQKTRYAPQDAQRLDGAGGFGTSQIFHFKAEPIEYFARLFFAVRFIAADEHGWLVGIAFAFLTKNSIII